MCRWAAYLGEAVFLEDIVTAPCHSLIAQSHCAQEAKSPTNGDGFGLAWYGDRPNRVSIATSCRPGPIPI